MYKVLGRGLKSAFGIAELIQNPPDHSPRIQPRKDSADTFDKS